MVKGKTANRTRSYTIHSATEFQWQTHTELPLSCVSLSSFHLGNYLVSLTTNCTFIFGFSVYKY